VGLDTLNEKEIFMRTGYAYIALAFVLAMPWTVSGQETPKAQNPEMNLQVKNALPADFRGSTTEMGVINLLEDEPYKFSENSPLYSGSASLLGGSKFLGPPSISWTTSQVNADGSTDPLSNQNTNKATNNSQFPEPGEYVIGNSGARQVSGSGGGASDNSGNAGSTAGSGTGSAAASGSGSRRVTSTQSVKVVCHDATCPNVWAIFQESAGNTTSALGETELKDKLRQQILANKGLIDPATALPEDLKGTSLLAVSEFPLNKTPVEKTAAVMVKGPLFNEVGKNETRQAGAFRMKVLDAAAMTRVTEVNSNTDLKGVYVRRNVPFIVTAMTTDNGDKCTTAAESACRIEAQDGAPVEMSDGSYLFRVPNYPRSEYKDQPEYQFVMEGADKDGNRTVVRLPLYVVNTQMAVEGGRNE